MFENWEIGKLKKSGIFEKHIRTKPLFPILPILFIFFVATPVSSQSSTQNQSAVEESMVLAEEVPTQTSSPSSASTFFVILRLVLVLALAAVAVYGLVFFLKKFSRVQEQKDPFLKILAGVSLGANRFIHIVSVGEQAWLVGSADGGVSLIAEINDKETVDALLLEESRRSAETAKATGFATLMRWTSKTTAGSGEPPKAENVRKTRERLRGL
ncbi:MAG: flagellar biosynthetic protein FliO [Treponema sp.]|jgi:flagellar protein FliO/FliZ|nr:flagellar biosynthetic protein FliO [Treponema sp.]